MKTKDWLASFGISTDPTPPEVEDAESPPRSAIEIAKRILVLHGLAAVGAGVDASRIRDWLDEQGLSSSVTPKERAFLAMESPDQKTRMTFFWHKEAQWTLLWAIGKIENLGLPITECDSARIVNDIMPALGVDTSEFINTAELRPPGVILAEDDRTYNIWCYANQASSLPDDLNMRVLYERRYAMEWLDSPDPWDEVTCDT